MSEFRLRSVGLAMLTASLAFAASPLRAQPVAQAQFQISDAEIANPERGFYRAAETSLEALSPEAVADAYADAFRLLYVAIDLEPYRRTDLPPTLLDALETGFATAREGGVKLIVRASYNDPSGETQYRDAQDAPLGQVLAHLAQLKPVFHRNADVIAFVQAGFVGAWGEWHTSSNDLTNPTSRTRIKDALLDATPATRFVQFRYPPYIQDWAPRLPGLDRAMDGRFRVGFHNDCFLASATDVGTFDEDAGQRGRQRAYVEELGALAPFGGETCNPADDPSPEPRTGCADILAEGARYKLTYLNDSYYRRLFHDNWRNQGCFDAVRSRMGYRFAFVAVSHPSSAAAGAPLKLSLTVRNLGWARLYNPRPVEILLRDRTTGVLRRLKTSGAEPRRWLPGADASETLTASLPEDLSGVQEVWLALPDASSRLRRDPRFSIRPANAEVPERGQRWDERHGAFATGTLLQIR